jgi:hypothetical protein
MKSIIITKKRILTALFCVFAVVIGIIVGVKGTRAVQTSAAKRELPIYNVKTDEKKIAISFDAAWGNAILRMP